MRILLDQGTPSPLKKHLADHEVVTAFELGWSELTNGGLLVRAERSFDLLITSDQQMRHQQNLPQTTLAIAVLMTTSWPRIEAGITEVMKALSDMKPGEYRETNLP